MKNLARRAHVGGPRGQNLSPAATGDRSPTRRAIDSGPGDFAHPTSCLCLRLRSMPLA